MKHLLASFTALLFSISGASAQTTPSSAKSTLTVHAGCPTTTAGDVLVTRSPVAAPSCAENGTAPMIISSGGMAPSGSTTGTGTGMPSQFTGAASVQKGRVVGIGGAVVVGVGAVLFL